MENYCFFFKCSFEFIGETICYQAFLSVSSFVLVIFSLLFKKILFSFYKASDFGFEFQYFVPFWEFVNFSHYCLFSVYFCKVGKNILYFISDISSFNLFFLVFLVNLAKNVLILMIFSKNQLIVVFHLLFFYSVTFFFL